METRGNREGYDDLHHAEVGSDNAAFVSRRDHRPFAIVGSAAAPPASVSPELADAGVTQFNVYLMNGDEEAQLDRYGAELTRLSPFSPSFSASATMIPAGPRT